MLDTWGTAVSFPSPCFETPWLELPSVVPWHSPERATPGDSRGKCPNWRAVAALERGVYLLGALPLHVVSHLETTDGRRRRATRDRARELHRAHPFRGPGWDARGGVDAGTVHKKCRCVSLSHRATHRTTVDHERLPIRFAEPQTLGIDAERCRCLVLAPQHASLNGLPRKSCRESRGPGVQSQPPPLAKPRTCSNPLPRHRPPLPAAQAPCELTTCHKHPSTRYSRRSPSPNAVARVNFTTHQIPRPRSAPCPCARGIARRNAQPRLLLHLRRNPPGTRLAPRGA